MAKEIPQAIIAEEELLSNLKTSSAGISSSEAAKRLKDLPKERNIPGRAVLNVLARQLKSPFVLLLFFATVVSFVLGERTDAIVIFAIIIVNSVIGFIEEYHSHRILEKLQKYIPNLVTVRREGKELKINSDHIAEGDIVILEAGDMVPADIRLLKTEDFSVDESVLTGESIPVSKNAKLATGQASDSSLPENCVFAGTRVTAGEGEGVIFAIGKKTMLGSIGSQAQSIQNKSIFEQNIAAFSRFLMIIVLVAMAAIFFISLMIKGGSANVVTLLLFVLALALGILPEALPVVTTITLSHGAMRLARRSVVVRRLSAIEDLGNIDVLCTDKTGTITENVLKVKDVYPAGNRNPILKLSLLGQEEDTQAGFKSSNPFDVAIENSMLKEVVVRAEHASHLQAIPFDPARRIGSHVVKQGGEILLISRGAPEDILKQCSRFEHDGEIAALTEKDHQDIIKIVNTWGSQGFRSLAIAKKDIEQKSKYSADDEEGLTFAGIIAFEDQLKKSATHALTLAKKLGVEIKILTGDHPNVARAVANQVGLISADEDIITSQEFGRLSDEELTKKLSSSHVFARVTPDDKLRIIQLLEKQGRKVAYMGDGINDVPSLAQAHVAIAVPSATSAAKEISDIVLLKKDLQVVVDGIHEGRKIFANITKYLKYSLGGNLGNFISLAAISLFSPLLPMLPTQILLGNFVSDFPLLAIGWDTVDMQYLKKPQNYHLSVIRNRAIVFALISSIFDVLFFGLFRHVPIDTLRTLWFVESMLTEILLLFSIRSDKAIFSKPRPALILTVLSFAGAAIAIGLPFISFGAVFHFVAPSSQMLLLVIVISLAYLIVNEIGKIFMGWSESSRLSK
jgi:Mg2+-importing ATPase